MKTKMKTEGGRVIWGFTNLPFISRDGNGVGFFGYPSRPAPNGTKFNFNKQV